MAIPKFAPPGARTGKANLPGMRIGGLRPAAHGFVPFREPKIGGLRGQRCWPASAAAEKV